MRDFCSRSSSLRSRSAIVTGERIFAWSTTLPVSGGKLAAASAAPAHSAATRRTISVRGQRRGIRTLPVRELELHFRRRLSFGIGGERYERLDRAKHRLRPEYAREGPPGGGEVLRRGDVIAAGDGDPVFRPLELGLEGEKILVRLEVGIVLADRQQTPEGARQRVLRILQLFDLSRVGQVVGVEVNRGRFGAGLGDLDKDVLFLLGVALNGRDQIGNEVGAALILVLNLRPSRVGGLLLGWDDIVATGGNRNGDERQNRERSQPMKQAHWEPLPDKTPLPRGTETNHKAPQAVTPSARAACLRFPPPDRPPLSGARLIASCAFTRNPRPAWRRLTLMSPAKLRFALRPRTKHACVLRSRLRSQSDQSQESGGGRLWQPGSRARSQHARQRREGDRGRAQAWLVFRQKGGGRRRQGDGRRCCGKVGGYRDDADAGRTPGRYLPRPALAQHETGRGAD